MYEYANTIQKQKSKHSSHRNKWEGSPMSVQFALPNVNAGVVQLMKDTEDVNAENEVNRLMSETAGQQGPLGMIVSTVGAEDMHKVFRTAAQYDQNINDFIKFMNSEPAGGIKGILAYRTAKQNYTTMYTNDFSRNHVSLNSSLIVDRKDPGLYLYNFNGGKINGNSESQREDAKARDFGIMLHPAQMLGRILKASPKDAASSSSFSTLPDTVGLEEEKIRRLGQEQIPGENSEIKSLSFGIDAFMGVLCNTSRYKDETMKVKYRSIFTMHKGMNMFRVFRIEYDYAKNKTTLKCIGKVTCNRLADQSVPESSIRVEVFT